MASNPSTSIKPLMYAKETILGMTRSLEQRFGCTPINDIGTTLNTKFGVQPSVLPTTESLVKYFCWGVGGRTNDSSSLSSARPVLGTNMALYAMRPFRAVPLENDLNSTERAQYAMRQVVNRGGTPYVLYYLKKITFPQSTVSYKRKDPTSGVVTDYAIDYTNLSPTPPVADDNGVITDVADSVSVVLPGQITITGQEVLESMAVMDAGDTRFSIVSELGFVSAATKSVSAVNANNVQFSYDEAIMAQLVDQYNWVGQPFLSTSDTWTRTLNFSVRNVITTS